MWYQNSVADYLDNDGKLAAEIDENYKLIFPITMQYLWNTKPKHLDYLSQMIRTHYFGDQQIGADTSDEMTNVSKDEKKNLILLWY